MDDDDGETGLPPSIEVAWGLRSRPTRGPKPGLTMQRIVQAAISVAVAEGLAAVSMNRVAAELGSSAMSLYRYVAAKDELLALMVDAAVGAPPAAPHGEVWRAGLTRWAWAYHEVLRRHAWMLRVPISGPPVTPNQTVWLEDGLCCLRATGLAESEKLSAILLLSGFVRNEAALTADIGAYAAASGGPAGQVMPGWSRLLRRVTTPEQFPALHRALASGAMDQDDDPDDEFAFGLERILDGIDGLVRQRG